MAAQKNAQAVVVMFCFLLVTFVNCNMDCPFANLGLSPGSVYAQTGPFEALKEEAVPAEEIADPLEPVNRVFFDFNDKLYFWVMKPVARVIKAFVPTDLRIAIGNALYNAGAPVRVANNLLQGKVKESGTEIASFAINSTIGFGGLFEPAQREFKLPKYMEDFGQTLAVWGTGSGVYLLWPFLGPSNVRDTFGRAGDGAADPVIYFAPWYVTSGIRAGDTVNYTSLHLGEYESFKKAALDPYISMRSAYHQYRENQIKQ